MIQSFIDIDKNRLVDLNIETVRLLGVMAAADIHQTNIKGLHNTANLHSDRYREIVSILSHHSKVEYSIPLLVFISNITHNEAASWLWAYTLHQMKKKLPEAQPLRVKDYILHFTVSEPNVEDVKRLWYGQIQDKHNLLENPLTWK